jgi:hypothetical protein
MNKGHKNLETTFSWSRENKVCFDLNQPNVASREVCS